jgi:glycosyltransferase involved in cell wall biosynthesis
LIVAGIPAYNEERTIAKVIVRAQKHVDRVIVCDDGSTDMTRAIAQQLGATVIPHERKYGYGAALASLFAMARHLGADVMVTLDGDGQHDPAEIPLLLRPILDGEADVVIGSRFLQRQDNRIPRYRKWGVSVINAAVNGSKQHTTDSQSGFRAYGRASLGDVRVAEKGMGASTELLLRANEEGWRLREVPIHVDYGRRKPTQHPFFQGLEVLASTVKFVSVRHPLLFYGVPGMIALLVALAFGIWTLQLFATTGQLVTNVALITLGAGLVGLVLCVTGMILYTVVTVIREEFP